VPPMPCLKEDLMENSDISGLILCNPLNSCKNNLWDGGHATGAELCTQSPRI